MRSHIFEDFCIKKGLRPISKASTPKGDIYIAETDLEMDRKNEFPWGYYQTFYCLVGSASKGEMDIGQWLEFDAMHDSDKGWTPAAKREARIRATEQVAEQFLNANIETRRYV